MKNLNKKLLLTFAAFFCLTLTACDMQSTPSNCKSKKVQCNKKSRGNNCAKCATCDCGDSSCFTQSCRNTSNN